MKLILRPIEDSETITELMGTGADLNDLPKLIWENDKGIQDFMIKQIQHYRSRATGCHAYFILSSYCFPVSSVLKFNLLCFKR